MILVTFSVPRCGPAFGRQRSPLVSSRVVPCRLALSHMAIGLGRRPERQTAIRRSPSGAATHFQMDSRAVRRLICRKWSNRRCRTVHRGHRPRLSGSRVGGIESHPAEPLRTETWALTTAQPRGPSPLHKIRSLSLRPHWRAPGKASI